MKRVLFIFAILGLTTVVAFGQMTERQVINLPSGRDLAKEAREVSGFTGINASSVFDITVIKSDREALVIQSDYAVMSYVRSEVRDGVLHLYLDQEFERRQTDGSLFLTAIVVMQNLEDVTLSGASRLTARDLFTPDVFLFNGMGSNSLSINVNTNQLDINVQGSSNIEINANVSGDTNVGVSGVGNISGNLITERIIFRYNGVGNVTLTGSANSGDIRANGTPTMNLIDFPIRHARVLAPGVANITVNATHTLDIVASGVSTVRYTGAATIGQRQVSAVSRVYRIQ